MASTLNCISLKRNKHMTTFKTRFDGVDISSKSIPEAIQRYREKIAESLQGMVDEGELDSDMRLTEIVQILLGEIVSE